MGNIEQHKSNGEDARRELPSVDAVLKSCGDLEATWGRASVVRVVQSELAHLRLSLGKGLPCNIRKNEIIARVVTTLTDADRSTFKQIFNLTGTILHTNLGRALLPQRAIDAMSQVASTPTNLEYDLVSGTRGERDDHAEQLICELLGTEAATVVNNNAAALLLVLNTLAQGLEIPVSRGELVEIGGSFRIPDIMEKSGCKLVEVGTTNRTHLKDYLRAVKNSTALILKVHTSNYSIEGFTSAVGESELAALAHQHNLPLVVDLGSGNLIDFSCYGLPEEPVITRAIRNGADIVTFSGDKLLGGPQSGIIAGRRDLIDQIRNNPLRRALRSDKLTLAALSEVLKIYRKPETLARELPTLQYLVKDESLIREQAVFLAPQLASCLPADFTVTPQPCLSQIGSGAMPVQNIPSYALAINATTDADIRRLSEAMRRLPCPVIGRLHEGKFLLDLRCLDDDEKFVEQARHLEHLLL
jgi:L-seryl-tRNA(Ser) seleniumtransferase